MDDSSAPLKLQQNIVNLCDSAFPTGGFFVEAPGHDGVTHSNSVGLCKLTLCGLMIDPSAISFAKLRKNRPEMSAANVALVKSGDIKSIEARFSQVAQWPRLTRI